MARVPATSQRLLTQIAEIAERHRLKRGLPTQERLVAAISRAVVAQPARTRGGRGASIETLDPAKVTALLDTVFEAAIHTSTDQMRAYADLLTAAGAGLDAFLNEHDP
jgi:hypothetical protein